MFIQVCPVLFQLLHRELAALMQKQKKESETEKDMYKKMMGTLGGAAQKPEKSDRPSNNVSGRLR
jgi:hypothetical protein